jgi:Na+/H+ antiporter NhaD/arsenite permease-like protein
MDHAYSPSPWMILPFVALLGLIALAPLWFAAWWEKHYPKVALALAAVTLAYYCFFLPPEARRTVVHTAREYFGFIALIGSLFVVSGGIHLTVKGEATPLANVVFLFLGALAANVLGTTGAAMLLIRPWLRMNRYRVTGHHVVFFIFIIANVGGCLTPIGDPPLFLGYLKGIPFFWVIAHCWAPWAVGLGLLLAIFYVLDRRNYLRAPAPVRAELAEPPDEWHFEGLWNLGFLALILAAVFVKEPPFLRELLMIMAAAGSYWTTRKSVHEANHFNFHPIQEVAILFIGIFATMMPALDWLQLNAGKFGTPTAGMFYWSSGALSSVLDNAPTYLSFLSAACGAFVGQPVLDQVQALVQNGGANLVMASEPAQAAYAAVQHYFPLAFDAKHVDAQQIQVAFLLSQVELNRFIVALSVGAVFFGANTYIGNGPNFMVKAIAHQRKVHTPSFLGYVLNYSIPIMLPVLLVVWWVFFRS